jgi:phosphoserine phosphatase RsbU/P
MDKLLLSAPCGFLSFTDDGTIILANNTLNEWLGYVRNDLAGKSIETIFPVATKIFYHTHLFPLIKLHGKADEIFLSLSTNAKESIPVLSNLVRKEGSNGFENHCVFIRVSQRTKYEDEILLAKKVAEKALAENKELQQLKAQLEMQTLDLDRHYQSLFLINQNLVEFSKIVSHDLQEPLRKIRLFTDVVRSDKKNKLSPQSQSAMSKIDIATERIKLLTTGLQEYISIDSDIARAQVDLNEVVEAAKEKAICQRNFSEFDLHYESLPTIEGFRKQLELFFYHLIDNSIKFRERSRKLTIQIETTLLDENLYKVSQDKYRFAEHIRISFADNGAGFDLEYKDYVVGMLKKMDPTTEGLGIGLSIIKKITENHNGKLDLHTNKGKGTTVWVTLPKKIEGSL